MEKILDISINSLFQEDVFIVGLIEFWEIQEIVKYRQLSTYVKEAIDRENYALFQKLRDYLHIPYTFDSSDLASQENIINVFKYVIQALKEEPQSISPFAFYTDGGVDTNSNYYFLQNVWKKTGIWYWTVANSNVHVQTILSKSIDMPSADNNPMNFLEDAKNKNKIRIPFENYIVDPRDDPFHILTDFQIHLRSGGYNAYIQTFAVFYSEQEIDNSKFQALTKRFNKVVKSSDLPLLRLNTFHKEENKDAGIKIYEFDVSKTSSLERWFKTKSFGIYPLLWITVKQKYVNKTINYKIRQRVAAKYISFKLIKSSNSNSNSNIDLYNLGLKSIPVRLETSELD